MTHIAELFGFNLRELRKERYWTINDLAEKAGVSQSTIWNAEMGKQLPIAAVIDKLAAGLDIEPSTLFLDNPDFYPSKPEPPPPVHLHVVDIKDLKRIVRRVVRQELDDFVFRDIRE